MKFRDIPRHEQPRPDFFRQEWINLNGLWQFKFDYGNEGLEKHFFARETNFPEQILVPFCPESSLSGIRTRDFLVSVWYRRKFIIPESWRKKKIFLHFGAADYQTDVWLNEVYLGRHLGGYTPFSFEITDFLGRGENILTVRCYDENRSGQQPCGKQSARYQSYGCHYTRVTGIWQTVWLEATGSRYLKSFRFFPDVDNEILGIWMNVAGNCQVQIEVFGQQQLVAQKTVSACGFTQVLLPIKNPVLWDVGRGYLYRVVFSLLGKGKLLDKVESWSGFRKIHLSGSRLFLNGRPLFMRFVLDQGYYPDGIYTAASEEALKKDILLAQAMGFTGARLHQKVFEPVFLHWADRLGYLVWGEYASWGIGLPYQEKTFPLLSSEWAEVINRDFNHPAIIGWCPLNETSRRQNPEVTGSLYRLTKKMDFTRPVIDTSGYVHVETDLYDCHNYTQSVAEFTRIFQPLRHNRKAIWRNYPDFDAAYQGQPYWVSEYGGTWWNGEGKGEGWGYGKRVRSKQEFISRYRGLTEVLLSHPRICGFCYTQLYDVEQEQNGLYTYRRKEKFPAQLIRQINTQPAAMEKG